MGSMFMDYVWARVLWPEAFEEDTEDATDG